MRILFFFVCILVLASCALSPDQKAAILETTAGGLKATAGAASAANPLVGVGMNVAAMILNVVAGILKAPNQGVPNV